MDLTLIDQGSGMRRRNFSTRFRTPYTTRWTVLPPSLQSLAQIFPLPLDLLPVLPIQSHPRLATVCKICRIPWKSVGEDSSLASISGGLLCDKAKWIDLLRPAQTRRPRRRRRPRPGREARVMGRTRTPRKAAASPMELASVLRP